MKIKNYTLAALALALLAGSACSKTAEPEQGSTAQSQQLPKHTVTISLEASFDDGFDEEARAMLRPTEDGTIKVEFKDTELMKDGATIDPATGKPVREMNTETGKLTLFFVEKSNLSNVISTTVNPSDFRKTADGKYVMTFYGDVVLSGLDMNQGEWYISGGYQLDAKGNETGNIAGATYLDANGLIHRGSGDITDFKTPFVFGWERLSTKQEDGRLAPSFGQNRHLKLVPDGVFLRIRAINNLVEDINLTYIDMRRENLGVGGGNKTGYNYTASASSTADLSNENRPYIVASVGSALTSLGLTGSKTTPPTQDPSDGLVLSSGDYYPWYQRINSPTNVSTAAEGTGLIFGFLTKERALGTDVTGTSLDSRETEGLTGTPKFTWPQEGPILTDDWRGGTLQEYIGNNNYAERIGIGFRSSSFPTSKTLKRGTINNINYRINSDLMITELYTTRFSERNGSYGLIELYNPTLDEIDLSKYALLRIGYRNDAGTNKIRVVPSTTEYNQNATNPGLNITNNISSALLLPLDMKNGDASGDWAVNSYSYTLSAPAVGGDVTYRYPHSIQHKAQVASPTTHSGFAANVVDFSTKGYITGLESITAGATKLKPGKTMIILFSGFAASNYSPTPEDQTIFARIQAAAQAGYCQYVVALGQGNTAAEPHTAQAGVTTADLGDAFSLVKIANVPSGLEDEKRFDPTKYRIRETRRIFVDGTWAPIDFDKGVIVGNLMANSSVKAILRRPYGPYMWNKGFLPPSDMSSYYQAQYTSADKATFGAPYFSSYEAGKTWNDVVKPRIEKRNASLFKRK